MADSAPVVFASYSHDSPAHIAWVVSLCEGLLARGVDVRLDQWDTTLGTDLLLFMEGAVAQSSRVLLICTENYVHKANAAQGGVGYERMIVTAALARDLRTDKFIPVVRGSHRPPVPEFLGTRKWIDFTDDNSFDRLLDELADTLYGEGPRRHAVQPRQRIPVAESRQRAPATMPSVPPAETFADRMQQRAQAIAQKEAAQREQERERHQRALAVEHSYDVEFGKLLDTLEALARTANDHLPESSRLRIERETEMVSITVGDRILVVRHHLRMFSQKPPDAMVLCSRRAGWRRNDVQVYREESLRLDFDGSRFTWSRGGLGEEREAAAQRLVERLLSEAT